MRRPLFLVVASVMAMGACGELRTAELGADVGADAGGSDVGTDGDGGTSPGADGSALDIDGALLPPAPDAGVGPSDPCRPIDACQPSTTTIFSPMPDVPLKEALALAKPNDTVQVRGGVLREPIFVPPGVTLRGCEGASILKAVNLQGGAQNVEGFTFSGGTIFVETTGKYVLRRNRFIPGPPQLTPAITVTTESLTPFVNIDLLIEESRFEDIPNGISAVLSANAGALDMSLTIQSSIFHGVGNPITARRTPNAARELRTAIRSNTFYDFASAIRLSGFNVTGSVVPVVTANIFSKGMIGIDTSFESANLSGYKVLFSFLHDVAKDATNTPPDGSGFVELDPSFVDAANGDFRLKRGSLAVDRVPAIVLLPKTDFQGCPRPGGDAVDPGALESQPPM